MSLLRKACGEHINLHIVEHDAFHRILITKLRKGLKYNFNDAKAWFLTHDHKLPQYSKHARNGKAHLPFCITTNEWIQINRPLLSRTISNEEFEESFHVLVTQSYVRSMLPTLPLDKAYNKILSKLERYSGMTPEVASRIASDTHFMVSILDIDDDEEINEKIESRLLDLNKELRRHNEELILEKKAEETKIDKLEKKVESISSQIEIEREKTRSIEQEKSNREKAFEKRIKELETGIETEKSEKKKLRDIVIGKEINEIVRIWKLPAYFSIIVIIIILAFIVMVFLFQDKEWNIVAKLFVWAESQSELRKEIFKWLLIMILGILQFLTVKFVWLRLFNKTAKKQHISEKLAEEQK